MADRYHFTDVGERFDRAYGRTNALREDIARSDAGNALTQGDYRGASNALYGAGMLGAGANVQAIGEGREAMAAKAAKQREDDATALWGETAGRLSTIADDAKDDPTAVVGAFDTFFAPKLQELGETPEEIAQVRELLGRDPRRTLMALGAGAAKQQGFEVKIVADEALVFQNGKLVNRYRGARTVNVPEGGAVYEIPGTGGGMGEAPDYRVPFDPRVSNSQGGSADTIMPHLIAQESGGNGNAIGPQTKYGQALGSTQMLPETAEAMARKLGVPWNPSLMRGDTPRALEYQRMLGQAYLQEGLDKYGGDPEKALMYYHGGPDESIWGPKTRAYAQQVQGRMGQGGDQLAGGSGGDQIAPGGPRLLVQRPKPPKEVDTEARDARQFTQENQLRGQFGNQPAVKDLASVQSHVRTIGAIAEKAKAGQPVTAADDLALIFAFMKMLDPGSVVREGEFANAQNTAGIPDRIRNAYNRAISGTRLSDKQRNEFFSTATTVMDGYTNSYADQAERSRGLATSYGLQPDRVAPTPQRPGPRGQAARAATQGENPALAAARAAIQKGAPRDAVIQRLRQNGIDPRGL